jgi:integrase/recombinase XerD
MENNMTPHEKRPCPITIRLAEDMRIRNLAHRTIDAYTYHVGCFADFIQKPLDCATPEDIRSFQLYLIDTRKLAYSSFNQAVCALRYLYTHTIRVSWPVTMVPFGKRPKTLPVVLGRHEVNELLACTKNLKQRTFITTLYATGMRFSEAANLHIHDIDSQRMQIRITNGKGAKQRQVPLSPRLLSELREYWKHYKPTSLLFFGKTPETTYCDTSIQKAIKASAQLAGKCSGGKRVDFNDKASKLILPGVTYYQVVCTLPSELSELALTNRQVMADLLVDSA